MANAAKLGRIRKGGSLDYDEETACPAAMFDAGCHTGDLARRLDRGQDSLRHIRRSRADGSHA